MNQPCCDRFPVDQLTRRWGDKISPLSPQRSVCLALPQLIILVTIMLLLSSCARLRRAPAGVALDLTAFLPPEWQAVGALQEINIDGDTAVEYLLLYTYDSVPGGTAGPVGALILDPQTEAVMADANRSILVRPTGFPNPYAVLPSYWKGAGQGFIAPPDQAGNINVQQVPYVTSGDPTQAPLADTLVIRGGPSYLTFVWWKNAIDGYGVTQLYAPGGFEGVDWNAWQQAPQRLDTVIGVQPLNNRSLFCRKTSYTRLELAPESRSPADYRPLIQYQANDQGLSFCFGAPTHPFYPEGVVLAYLQDTSKRLNLLTPALQNDADGQARLNAVLDQVTLLRVDEVSSYQDIPVSLYDAANPQAALTTTACAQVLVQPSPEGASPEQRWLLFTLQHQPPQLDPATSDLLRVAGISVLPAPVSGATLSCAELLGETQ